MAYYWKCPYILRLVTLVIWRASGFTFSAHNDWFSGRYVHRYIRWTQYNSLQFAFQSLLKTHTNVPKHQEKRNANASLQFSGISASRAKFSVDENKPFYCACPAENMLYNILTFQTQVWLRDYMGILRNEYKGAV